jgi:hypothetical protein
MVKDFTEGVGSTLGLPKYPLTENPISFINFTQLQFQLSE